LFAFFFFFFLLFIFGIRRDFGGKRVSGDEEDRDASLQGFSGFSRIRMWKHGASWYGRLHQVEYAMEAVRQVREFSDSDTDVVTWSPVGWLYHLEYAAMEAVKQGSAAIAFRS
jgi:hypothetical protein